MSRHEEIRLVPERDTLWSRLTRSIRLGPFSLKDKALVSIFGGGPTMSGVSVDEFSALTSSPVWSGVTMIADDIASLPLFLYRRLPNGGKDRYEAHPLYGLLHDAPNPEMDSLVFRRTMQIHLLLWQNAYAEIERDKAGRPVALWPLVPERVTPFRDGIGQLVYRVTNENGGHVILPARDTIHLVGYSHDGSVGSSMVQKARESIALGLAAEKFGASFYGNGATFGGVILFKGPKPDPKAEKGSREALEARHQGVDRAYKLLALYNDAKYETTGVKPNEGQFIETRIFQIREVARWLKIPPHKLGDLADATYSNVEQMDAAYLSSCLRPWLKLWEQQLSRKLISHLERRQQFIEHDTHGFLSVDAAGRSQLYTAEFHVASITPNDIRGYENRDPIDGGDDAFIQTQNIPLSMVRKYWELEFREKEARIERLKDMPAPPPREPVTDLNRAIEPLAKRVEALTAEKAEADAARRAAETRAEDLAAAYAGAEAKRDEALAELAQALENLTGAEAALAAEQAERARETEELRDQVGDWKLKAEQAGERADALAAEAEDLRLSLAASQEERQAAEARVRALEADVQREQENMRAATRDYEERTEALQAEKAAAEQDRDDASRRRMEAEAAKAQAEQRAADAERDKAIAEQAQRAANEAMEAQRQREQKRAEDVIVALRGMMSSVMAGVVRYEADRAQAQQATPAKLRAWTNTFYEQHEAVVAERLLPVLRVHLAWMQSDADPEAVAKALASEHCAESIRQVRDVLELDDYRPALAHLVQRWEQRRPEALADRLVREGVGHARSI